MAKEPTRAQQGVEEVVSFEGVPPYATPESQRPACRSALRSHVEGEVWHVLHFSTSARRWPIDSAARCWGRHRLHRVRRLRLGRFRELAKKFAALLLFSFLCLADGRRKRCPLVDVAGRRADCTASRVHRTAVSRLLGLWSGRGM